MEKVYDIVIVGAGPAGLSAAIYGLRSGKSVLLLEAKTYGGQIINTPKVENYPGIREISGYAFAQQLYEQATSLGAELSFEKVLAVKKEENKRFSITTGENEYKAQTVILATGAKNRQLGVPEEERFIGAGVSYCATCDGMFFRDKNVAVVGGGNTALEDAMFLSNYCKHVYLIHRRDAFRGDGRSVEQLENRENVTFVLNSVVKNIVGKEKVTGLILQDVKTKEEEILDVEGVFVAVGQMPDNMAFEKIVDLDSYGYIMAGEDCFTKTPGIFTAGDCRTKKVRQLTTAAAEGASAALAACEFLNH